MKHIKLKDWSEFGPSLQRELAAINHNRMAVVRTFNHTTFELGENFEMGSEVDRLPHLYGAPDI